MPWTFEISTGKMFQPDGSLSDVGYSGGELGKRPDAVNNPACESLKNIGPIPEGFYTMGEAIDHPHLGQLAIPLVPDEANKMYDRSGFYCHGDTASHDRSASEGCIIMPFPTRMRIMVSTDKKLRVTAGDLPVVMPDITV